MFQVTPGKVLNAQEINVSAVKQIVASVKFPERKPEHKKVWNSRDWTELEKAWENYTGPVRDLAHFAVLVDYALGDENESTVYTCIEYNNCSSDPIEVSLVSQEDVDEYPELFTTVDKIKPIREVKLNLSPNSKCSCGSGKKYKKCCMFK